MQVERLRWDAIELLKPALGEAPEALDAVDMTAASDKLIRAMIDSEMLRIADINQAIERGAAAARVYLIRAQVREKLGDAAGAREDRQLALRTEPGDEAGWVARGTGAAPRRGAKRGGGCIWGRRFGDKPPRRGDAKFS